jgi:hypothetical protein
MESHRKVDENIFALHETARRLLAENKEEEYIRHELTKEGIDPGYAELIIDNVKTELSDKLEFRKELFKGISITTFGVLLNLASYAAFASVGAFFWFLYWGMIVFGITLIARAFIIFKN